jgi:tRNA-specific 2-thiouridylase
VFPVGGLRKAEVRRLARERGLPVADKRDSQEICFVPGGDYAAVVERFAPGRVRPGAIVDRRGRTLGSHRGVHRFTVGQRKGLGLASPTPLYVTGIDAVAATVTVGTRQEAERAELTASGVTWISGQAPDGAVRVAAQIRYRHPPSSAVVEPLPAGRARVTFDTPQPAVTPGQAVVFYGGDAVLGGGWID